MKIFDFEANFTAKCPFRVAEGALSEPRWCAGREAIIIEKLA